MFLQQLLKKHEYFGKYGKILKVIINPSTNYAGPQVCILSPFLLVFLRSTMNFAAFV